MESFPSRFLSFMETREQRLLSWGFYDVSFTASEISTLLKTEGDASLQSHWQEFVDDGWSMAEFVDEMEAANLLYSVDSSRSRFRSRFAETVRLAARLRQMFREEHWSTGPSLVSDIKLHLKPRKYPKLDQPASDCWSEMNSAAVNPEFQKLVFDKLCGNPATNSQFSFSAFQKRAFTHILSKYDKPGVSGSVICAGTGAGKTKAFYVPAILGAVSELDKKPFTKIIAIYPRNVLLADQFREALSEVMKLNSLLKEEGIRPFRLGALLGNTPYKNWFDTTDHGGRKRLVEKYANWRRVGKTGNYVLPFLRSPFDADAELVWREADRKANRNCLYRADGRGTSPEIPDGMVSLTREELMASPPDILFLSLEMLNRELGNPAWSRTFGIRDKKFAPRLLLLDEVHSYEGIQGAQVAWVLRRWRHACRSNKLHVVGLSATLKQAPDHLSRVSAVKSSEIAEFRPNADELKEESIEYNIAIKGDPAAGANLLSTSIQCGMLLARTLTPRGHIPSTHDLPIEPHRFFAQKVFGFTDNLDVVNRWLSDMSDAERNRLARLRLNPTHQTPRPDPLPSNEEITRRHLLGQIWDLPRKLGYDLASPLRVGRCSSQDPGLAANDDLVIATSSLEVGFDDPAVGAVIQHKRPMSTASFVQRKGRAGRTRGSRPWTMIILSDYGGDRVSFQQVERLFEPELDGLSLPYQNHYVLRVQATFFLLDWIGRRVGKEAPFNYLRRPVSRSPQSLAAQKRAVQILEDFLNQGVEWKAFREDAIKLFSGPLSGPFTRLTEDQVDGIFWELPRPLLRQVIPCLLRKLERQWSYADDRKGDKIEDQGVSYPLPEFLPSATFSELDVTETRIGFVTQNNRPKDDEFMDVSQVLNESCPARASKRFSTQVDDPGFWHEYSVNLADGRNKVSARTLYPSALDLGTFDGVRVFQPESVTESHRPNDVLDSSYGSWNWNNDFRPIGSGYDIPLFSIDPWKQVVRSTRAFLHRDQSGIDVTRFARSFDFEIRYQRGRVSVGTGDLTGQNEDTSESWAEAVGFQRRVDGIMVELVPDHVNQIPKLPKELMARFRSDYYLHVLKKSELLPPEVNGFLREWIWQTSLAMLTATALHNNCSLKEAQRRLEVVRLHAAERVIASIFHVRDLSLQGPEGRLIENILAVWRSNDHIQAIKSLESLLWIEPDTDFDNWVRSRYVATLAQSFRSACVSSDLEINEDDLLIDVSELNDAPVIVLTEKQSGGLGVIERIIHRLGTDPHRFHNGMRHVLRHCQRQQTTSYLRAVVEDVLINNSLEGCFGRVRSAKGFKGQEKAKSELQRILKNSGFDATRDRFVALMSKVLQPGSSSSTDVFIRDINTSWHDAERELQVGIDSRVFAYSALQTHEINEQITTHFGQLNGGSAPSPAQTYNATERFLFPTCLDACQECLVTYNRYNDFGMPSRELANVWLGIRTSTIFITAPQDEWESDVQKNIVQTGMVAIHFANTIATQIVQQLNEVLAKEIEVGILFHPLSIQRIEKDGNAWLVTLQLKDLVHGH